VAAKAGDVMSGHQEHNISDQASPADQSGGSNLPYTESERIKVVVWGQSRRVFPRFVHHGCGIGCSYCYIDGPADPPVYLNDEEVETWLRQIPEGPSVTVSLASDTEPFLTARSIDIAERYLRACQQRMVNVQISTKCQLPKSTLALLDQWQSPQRPVVFTTITSVELAARLEPGAVSPALRAVNFQGHSDSWRSVALVKPLLHLSITDRHEVAALLADASPDAVVLGVRYWRAHGAELADESLLRHPCDPRWVGVTPSDRDLELVGALSVPGRPIFMNTECVVDYFNHNGSGRQIFERYNQLCTHCGVCEGGG